MKQTRIFGIFLILITCLILITSNIIIGESITSFSRGLSGDEVPNITYNLMKSKAGDKTALEATGYFTIPTHRGKVKNASFNIYCTADTQGNHMLNPKIDIGLDGDYEWMYSGKGYGKAGQQTEFSTGRTKTLVVTAERGTEHFDNKTVIYLPKDCQVTNASMMIKGGPGKYKEDLAVGISYNRYIYYTKGTGGTFFGGVQSFTRMGGSVGYNTYAIGLGDFDNDNDLDIISGYKPSYGVSPLELYVFENTGTGANPPWKTSPVMVGRIPLTTSWGYLYSIGVEDFDGDGNMDVIAMDYNGGNIHFFRGYGTNLSFKPRTVITSSYPGSRAYDFDAEDFNNDGYIDYIGSSNSANVYYGENNGDGTFKSAVQIPAGTSWGYQYLIVGADYNDDDKADILTKYYSSPTNLIKGNGDGTFQNFVNSGLSLSGYAPGDNYDFNYDGYQDLIVCEGTWSGMNFVYYPGKGDGTFGTSTSIGSPSSSYIYAMAAPPRMPLGGCNNLAIDIGDDKTQEIKFKDDFTTGEEQIYFGQYLNQYLGGSRSRGLETVVDGYGNEMVKIPLRFDSDTIGSVMLYDLDIKYDYTAKVELLPGMRYNLTTDLNDLLPTDTNETSEVKVYFGLYSDTPGKATLSNLNIEYNGAPDYTEIPTLTVDEDSDKKALDLSEYFTDDYDTPSEMTYGISYNGDPEHLKLSTDGQWLRVNTTLEPNWHGSAEIGVWCKDTEGVRTDSNVFKLKVTPVDDPPMSNNPLPNVELKELEERIVADLDDPVSAYFIDVDSSKLYFRALLSNPDDSDLITLEIIKDLNELRLKSLGSFGRNIEVVVYCDDDNSILGLSESELKLLDSYQIFFVNITSLSQTFPPQWLLLEVAPIPEDTPQENILKLNDYVTDPDDKLGNLTYSIYSMTHSGYIDIIIDDETSALSIYPRDNFDGKAKVTLAVTDDEQNRDLTMLLLEIIPYNDQPLVEISEPADDSKVRGLVEVIGSAYDPEDALSKVEISIDNGPWLPVNGLSYWTYTFDSYAYSSKSQILIKARAEDATSSQSLPDEVSIRIQRPSEDSDGDGVQDNKDKFPLNPSEWKDSDGDGVGDNTDHFPNDISQWLDTDGDGYGDNPQGNQKDWFPFDPTQWSDSDGDGHGDNDWGNEGDYFPYDPGAWKKPGEATGSSSESSDNDNLALIMQVILIVVVIVALLILINYGYQTMKKKNK
jgi:hypothetical protein